MKVQEIKIEEQREMIEKLKRAEDSFDIVKEFSFVKKRVEQL